MMDFWKLRNLPKPKSLTTASVVAGLPRRGLGMMVDRRRYRMTPTIVANYWPRRYTPVLSSPAARSTPIPTTTPGHYTPTIATSAASVANLNSPTWPFNVKKPTKETRRSAGTFKVTSSDVTALDGINSAGRNVAITTSSEGVTSCTSVTRRNRSTTSSYQTNSFANSSQSPFTTCNVSSYQHVVRVNGSDVRQNDVIFVSRDASSHVTPVTSQDCATSSTHDIDKLREVDGKVHAALAEDEGVQSVQETTASVSSERETLVVMTYVDTQTQRSGSSPVNEAIQVTNNTGVTMSHEGNVLSGSSREVTTDVSYTLETETPVYDSWKDITSDSATVVDHHSIRDQFVSGPTMKTDDSAAKSSTTSSAFNWSAVTANETGRGRGELVTSHGRQQPVLYNAATSTRFSHESTSFADETFSLWPRGVMMKPDNSTDDDSALYWNSSQLVIPLLTVAVILALCLLVIAVACAVRYAGKYCCCLAGSYTPSPSPPGHRTRKPDRLKEARCVERQPRIMTRAAQLAESEPAYRSVVIIGSDRLGRRAADTKHPPRPWVVRQPIGSAWGNLALINNDTSPLPPPPPPPLPRQTIVLGKRKSSVKDDDDDTGTKTVPVIVSQLEGRMNVTAQVHNSQPKLHALHDTN